MKKILIIVALLSVFKASAQSYFELIREGEKKLLKKDFEGALNDYESAFQKYDTPFLKDVVTAACFAHYANNNEKLHKHLDYLLKFGASKNYLLYFQKKRPNDQYINSLIKNYNSYEDAYLKSINNEKSNAFLTNDINSRNELDNNADNRLKNNLVYYKQHILNVEKYGFPTYKDTGIGCFIGTEEYKNKSKLKLKNKYTTYFNHKQIDNNTFTCNYVCKVIKRPSIFSFHLGNHFINHTPWVHNKEFDSLFRLGVKELKIHPYFYLANLERGNYLDAGLSSSSEIVYENHYKLKKIVENSNTNTVNKIRNQYGLRSVEQDLELAIFLTELEGVKFNRYFGKSRISENPFIASMFCSFLS